ncbi:alpha-(1-_3)-arabinofuranosyltransferase domain-containing protein [Thermomonospora amylolytica]|uniref:alpha-(1->3)-arabinofuranosyltransferase domain-containing protein n=1 Tax=Thermomonospora amylolytica TaxID=1411117 RepID=UPI001300A48E|nr:alpha-(1->3)-arabinofuranosyltransferase family protein [Thermomonospora amylolytica]
MDALALRLADADRDAAAREDEDVDARLRERIRLVACCLALTVLAMATRPGRILADTKIDMAENPLGFLGRALHLWDPEQFGQLQNQAVGYWFPMGPFYALGDLAGTPAWITQRLWLALLLCLAFVGTHRLAARLGIGGPLSRLAGGLAYALTPHGLSTLGQISSEYLPLAMLPWIVLPLVTAVQGGGRIRAAARSGFAVACCGGINAAATAAVLVVPFLYLLTRPRGTPRIRLTAWWSLAVGLASAWWLAPLLLTGTYGFSWLTYTEKAETTTASTGLVNVLRGAARWVNYLVVDGQVWSPVGHTLSLGTLPVLCAAVVAALGLTGLLRSRLPERAFLLCTLLAGLAIMSAGHLSAVEGPFAAAMRDLLDGPLAPLRNLHKFDALVRLPLALGIAHLPVTLARARHRLRAFAVTYTALAGVAAVALGTGLSGAGDFPQVPKYWRDAASWLNGRAGEQAVLALPGSPFGEYLWGRPMDDIMQPLLSARWGVRQLVPAGSPGYTRALDAIDQRVVTGRASPGLTEFLGRMGVRYLLVRNDLERDGLRGGWPARLHQVLDATPGLSKVAEFGGPVGQQRGFDAISSVDQRYPALEIYEVDDVDDVVSVTSARDTVRLYGGPEALLAMADDQVLRGRAVLLNDDAPRLGGTPVVSDSLRLTRRQFGELHQISQTLTAAERRRATDILDDGWDRYVTTAVYGGIASVTASTSASDPTSPPQWHDLGRNPYAAVDGDPSTYWQTGGWTGPRDQWIQVNFTRPVDPGQVTAMFVQNEPLLGPPPARVEVRTEAGAVVQPVRAAPEAQTLQAPRGATRWLRVRILDLAGRVSVPVFFRAGIAELTVPGVTAARTFRLPEPGSGSPAAYVLQRGPGRAAECMRGPANWVCDPGLERQDEEGNGFDRTFRAGAAADVTVVGTATLTSPEVVARYTAPNRDLEVAASSSRPHPAAMPRSAFDGNPSTVWVAAGNDTAPRYTVRWKKLARLDEITVERPAGARGPLRVAVQADRGQTREGFVDDDGVLRFAPLRTRSLTLTFHSSVQLALQITDITVPGVRHFPDVSRAPLGLGCGWGPSLRLNGATVFTKATGTMGDLLAGRPIRFESCRRAEIAAGDNRVTGVPLSPFRIESAVVDTGVLDVRGETSSVVVREWNSETRVVEVDAPEQSFLTVNENYNAGWVASAGDTVLQPVRLDGWKQGWVLPAGTTGTVTLTYRPDQAHKVAVFTGLGLVLLLTLVAAMPGGRRPGDTAPALPPVRTRRGAVPVALVGSLALGVWVAGVPGAVTSAVGALLFTWACRRTGVARLPASPWAVTVLMLAGTTSWLVSRALYPAANPAAPTDLLGDVVPQLAGLLIATRVIVALCMPDAVPAATAGPPRRTDLRWRPSSRPEDLAAPAARS